MTELDRSRVASVFAADAAVEFRADALAEPDRHFHELADTQLVELRERVVLEDLLVVVGRQELARVVARETVRHLSEVVRAEAEELRLLGDRVGREGRARDLDHRAHLVGDVDVRMRDFLVRRLDDDVLDVLQLLRVARERNHDLRLHRPRAMSLLHLDGRADDRRRLHASDLRIGDAQAAAAMSHHRIELLEGVDELLNLRDRLVLGLCKQLDLFLRVRHELV